MLTRLSVKNFAIIEDLTVQFNDSMTVLTGETGAGKSLIIDSISLLLGSRADSDMIRYGNDKAYITGEFTYQNKKIDKVLERYNIPTNQIITIYREIALNGKNVIKVNNSSVSLVILKEIALLLADIHVQHDTYRLINPDTYLSFIDNPDDEKLSKLLNDYVIALDSYSNLKKEYDIISKKKETSLERLDFIKYERDEIKSLDLTVDCDLELNEEISKLSNYDKIYKNLNEAYQLLENEYFSLDNIYNAYKNLSSISDYDKTFKENSESLESSYYALTDVKQSIYKTIDNLDFDEDHLNSIQERLNEIENVKKKYKMSVNELLDYLKKISLEIELVLDYDNVIKEYEEKLNNSFINLSGKAKALTKYRKAIALDISKAIVSECRDLELPNTSFEIVFNECDYNDYKNHNIFKPNGVDEVSFMISLNKGEPLKPLNKVASGGELSRIMLAFKSYFSSIAKLSLIVFDEIDSGVSGSAAFQIAQKMKKIAEYSQVLCITHLPQVAGIASNHLHIFKEEIDGRTKTNIEVLDYEGRVSNIAMMMSGSHISKASLDAAREMIKK